MLSNLFKGADLDAKGALPFAEFRRLLHQADLGLSLPELQLLLSEADESSSGMVGYVDFIPLAVDMIFAFRARGRARRHLKRGEAAVDDQVLTQLAAAEVEQISGALLPLCREKDTEKLGSLFVHELKTLLNCSRTGLTPVETNLVLQSLPRTSSGRVRYGGELIDAIRQVKCSMLKNAMVEAQSSDMQRQLMQACELEELRTMTDAGQKVLTGWLAVSGLLNVLLGSTRLPLSRLQAMVLLRDAESVDGVIDYRKFIPLAAKSIEFMFERDVDYTDNYLIGAAFGRDFRDLGAGFVLGGVAGVAVRLGDDDDTTGEVWAGLRLRHHGLVIGDLAISPGVTAGLSAVSGPTEIERLREISRDGDATLLGFVGPELSFRLRQAPDIELVYQLHHRSGANGFFGDMAEGFNANTIGLRYRF